MCLFVILITLKSDIITTVIILVISQYCPTYLPLRHHSPFFLIFCQIIIEHFLSCRYVLCWKCPAVLQIRKLLRINIYIVFIYWSEIHCIAYSESSLLWIWKLVCVLFNSCSVENIGGWLIYDKITRRTFVMRIVANYSRTNPHVSSRIRRETRWKRF